METLNNKKVLVALATALMLIALILGLLIFKQSNKSRSPKIINLPGSKEQTETSKTDQSAPPAEDKGQDNR